ncbi:serine/threonine protein kinase [Gordonibacter sp. 28C]|nr:serine/threonine protein kinase [Gordonibacter sp. 28C]
MPSFDEVDWDDAPPWEDPSGNDALPWNESNIPPWEDMPATPPPDFESPFRKRDQAEARRAAAGKRDDLAAAPAYRDPADEFPPVRSLSRIPGLDEARTAAMLTDPNIVTVYDFEVQGRTAYLIMEYIEGITLTELLRDYASYLTLDMVAAVFGSIAHALEVAHENQVLHLDIKPDNVLINRQGQVKVTDFGLATLADAGGFGAAGGGTIGYMPLEQMRGENLDARCDEWALASVAYEMLAGENPFIASDLSRAESAIEDAELVLPSLCWDDLDPAADDVVFYALDPDREQRYDSVTDFAEEMERFLGEPKQGHRELAVIVGDAQGEGDGTEEAEAERAPRAPRVPLRERLTSRQATVAAHVVGAAGSGAVTFVALANLPQIGGLNGILGLAGPAVLLFWGLLALIALAGALKPHLGALLAYFALAAALIAQNAPAIGCVLLAATAVWWYFAGRAGNAAANAALAVPLAGAVGGNQLAPAAAGLFLPPLRALGTTAFSLLVAAILASFGAGNLLGWDAFAYWEFAGTDVQANLGALLLQPATWCVAASWLVAAGALAVCRRRPSRVLEVLGVALAGAALAAGMCAAAWFASGQHSWMPSVPAVVSTVAAVAFLVAASYLSPPSDEEWGEWPDEELYEN